MKIKEYKGFKIYKKNGGWIMEAPRGKKYGEQSEASVEQIIKKAVGMVDRYEGKL